MIELISLLIYGKESILMIKSLEKCNSWSIIFFILKFGQNLWSDLIVSLILKRLMNEQYKNRITFTNEHNF